MRSRKMAAGVIAAAVAVASLPQAVSAEEREYRCEWVNVLPDSQYKLSVENVEVDGTEKCRVRLSNIPDAVLDFEYDLNFIYNEMKYTGENKNFRILIDVDDGKKFIALTILKEQVYYETISVGDHGVEYTPYLPDENGKYCYVDDYYKTITKGLGSNGMREPVVLNRNSEGEAYFEFYLDSNNEKTSEYAEYLLKANTTTVLTYALIDIKVSPLYTANSSGYLGYIGFLSDGTMIRGDGQYIDCDTGEVKEFDYYNHVITDEYLREEFNVIDSFSEIPKETVKISIETNNPEVPDTTNTFIDEETGAKVVDKNGALPENAEMSVTYDDKDKDHGIVMYVISFKDENGEACNPTSDVEVWLPIPEEFQKDFQKNERSIKVNIRGVGDLRVGYQDGSIAFITPRVGEIIIRDLLIIDDEGQFEEGYSPIVTDKETGISVIGAIPGSAQLVVAIDTENSTDTRLFFDITLVKDDEECQPEGKVTVKIPVPEEFKDKADILKVYHFIDGKYEDMNAKLEDGYLVFETDHFSIYVVTPETISEDGGEDTTDTEPAPSTRPNTGDFIIPATTTTTATAADTTSAPQAAETTATVADTTTATTTTTTTAAPEATTAAPTSDNGTAEQPIPTEGTSDNGSANVGNDGAANGKGENPDTGYAIAIVPIIVAAAAVSFIAYKRKK